MLSIVHLIWFSCEGTVCSPKKLDSLATHLKAKLYWPTILLMSLFNGNVLFTFDLLSSACGGRLWDRWYSKCKSAAHLAREKFPFCTFLSSHGLQPTMPSLNLTKPKRKLDVWKANLISQNPETETLLATSDDGHSCSVCNFSLADCPIPVQTVASQMLLHYVAIFS